MKLIFILSLLVLLTRSVELPSGPDVIFVETFEDDSERWVPSKQEKYVGTWNVREADPPVKIPGEKGLVAENEAKHHGISVRFEKPVNNKGKDLVVQYEVRLQKGLQCGGAYIKLLAHDTMPKDLVDFVDSTPYSIMFGPDRCGTNDKVHFIFRHQNPVSKEWEEKHLNKTSPIKSDTLTHLYTLHVTPDNHYEVFIDQESVSSGSLFENFNPPVNPPLTIDDPNDKKPSDWVDEAEIVDPTATKPDDWDEDAPAMIVDTNAVKPSGWLDNEPEKIPDPNAGKPDDWDDELDGEYEAPIVDNPKCDEVGCGEWKQPLIPNPNYKGKWKAPMIPNPKYIGEWKPKQIPNPNYFEEKNPYIFTPIGGIGIEIWTMQDGIMYDNIILTYSKEIADKFADETFKIKREEELRLKKLNEPEETYLDNALKQINKIVEAGIIFARDEQNIPVVIGSLVIGIIVPVIMCCCLGGKKKSKTEKRTEDEDETEKTEEKKSEKKEKKVEKKVEKKEKTDKKKN